MRQSIESWYSRNARLPLLLVAALIVAMQVFYLVFNLIENDRKFNNAVDTFVRGIQVALVQQNRVVIESLVHGLAEHDFVQAVVICDGNVSVFSFPMGFKNCGSSSSTFLNSVEARSIPGFQSMSVHLETPWLKLDGVSIAFGSFSLILLLLLGAITNRAFSKFNSEVLLPIMDDFRDYSNGKITELMLLRDRRLQFIELEKGRAVADMAKQVAHDIRSPLSALKIIAGRSKNLTDEEKTLLELATHQVQNISEDILNRTRKKSNQANVLQLRELVGEVVRLKEVEFAKSVTFKLVWETNADFSGCGDAVEFKRCLSNLINNAVEAYQGTMQEQVVHINAHHEDNFAVISIQDFGKGISREMLSKIEINQFSSAKENGNGLGLSSARRFMSDLGGKLSVTSEIGKGTTIGLLFPTT